MSTGGISAPFISMMFPNCCISGKCFALMSMQSASISLPHTGVMPCRFAASGKPAIPSNKLPNVIFPALPCYEKKAAGISSYPSISLFSSGLSYSIYPHAILPISGTVDSGKSRILRQRLKEGAKKNEIQVLQFRTPGNAGDISETERQSGNADSQFQ